jgi:hypothetical protein
MGQFSMKICPQVGQFLMELNRARARDGARFLARLICAGVRARTIYATRTAAVLAGRFRRGGLAVTMWVGRGMAN